MLCCTVATAAAIHLISTDLHMYYVALEVTLGAVADPTANTTLLQASPPQPNSQGDRIMRLEASAGFDRLVRKCLTTSGYHVHIDT